MALASILIDIAPIYTEASIETVRLDEVLFGMTVEVLQESNKFCKVRTEYGTEGYIETPLLGLNNEIATSWKKYKKQIVVAPYIDIQKAPAKGSVIIASVPRGGVVVPLGAIDSSGWQKVGIPTGATGYTRASYLAPLVQDWMTVSQSDMRWNIVEAALTYNGSAFREGGRTILGIDGIGLAAMSYWLNGVSIARENFVKPGTALHVIPKEKMDEGDIIFFENAIGIFMGGDKFVYACEKLGAEGVFVGSFDPDDAEYKADLANQISSVGSLF